MYLKERNFRVDLFSRVNFFYISHGFIFANWIFANFSRGFIFASFTFHKFVPQMISLLKVLICLYLINQLTLSIVNLNMEEIKSILVDIKNEIKDLRTLTENNYDDL